MKKLITMAAIIASLLGTAKAQEKQPEHKINLVAAEVISEKKPLMRAEVVARELPYNSDVFITWEHRDNDFYLLRAQTLPVSYGAISIGASVRHIDGGIPRQDIGGVIRAKGKVSEDIFAKADLRWFPKQKIFDTYAFADSKNMFTDLLGSYSTETSKIMMRPGIDYKVTPNLSMGIESLFEGELSKVKLDYAGIRGKLIF